MPCALVIPAAGNSERFKPFCGELPKGLVRFTWRGETKTMIEHAIPKDFDGRVIVMCRAEHRELFLYHLPTRRGSSPVTVFTVEETLGQADTVNQAAGLVAVDEEMLVVNCDNGFDSGMEYFLRACRMNKADAGAVVFAGRGCTRYGYVNDFPFFQYGVEKRAISNYALAGAFYFRSIYVVMDAFKRLSSDTDEGELYLSSMFRHISSPKVAYNIQRQELHEWGTPELLLKDYDIQLDTRHG